MATYTESGEGSAATWWMRIRTRFARQARFTEETLRAVEEARSAAAAAREASERAAEAAAETHAAILDYLNGAAKEAKGEPRDTPEEELGKLFCAYLQRGRLWNISATKMLTDLDDEAVKLHRGVLLAVDTMLSAEREEKDALTAGRVKVLMDWKKRAHELEGDHHQSE
ncbi:hypothetical protein AB0C14_10910 [Microbispora hainanensis]|uniref:hypothetical protein n=1 Tax=Microbispora hainanensis TaxID=568844 RepID=UPI0033D53B88